MADLSGPPGAFLDSLRPQSVKELHETVAAGARRRKLPSVVAQLAEFCENRGACEERCVARLRERATLEGALIPGAEGDAPRREQVQKAVAQRFGALEEHCGVLCGRRFAHLVSNTGDAS
eukprot:TRINITY_DN20460_c0_g1_i1.p4 TRINITY_DN20460_c0_g1~~TRINITY_DN20460_c0_g1_i1.p4  ORF type:complete len:120 (+),score=23.79 TRINITY_DN20460_c0_g1_i1:67-426(+)